MAGGADNRPASDARLAREELLAMTTHAGIVIGKVGGVREFAFRVPVGRNVMTSIALQRFMFVGRMKKSGILRG